MIKNVALVALVLGIGSMAGYLVRARSGPESRLITQVTDLEQRVHELEAARESDRQSLRSMLGSVANVAAANGRAAGVAAVNDAEAARPAPSSACGDEPHRGRAEDKSPEALQAKREAFLAGLDKAIEAPPVDPSWGVPALREAEAVLASKLTGARIIDKRCGGELCRLVVEFGPDGDPSSLDADLAVQPPFNRGSTFTQTPANGREPARSNIYLTHTAGS